MPRPRPAPAASVEPRALSTRSLRDRIRALAEPLAELRGCEVVGVELVGAPTGGRVLRVSIDKVGGATIEDCTRVSRALSPALDAEDVIATAYTLEVGTPGQERPLQRASDWERFVGCACRIKTWEMDGRRRLKGTIRGCVDGVVHVDTESGPRSFPLDEIERANLVLDFEQYTRLGQGLHPLADGERDDHQ